MHSTVRGAVYTLQYVAQSTLYSTWRSLHSTVRGAVYTLQPSEGTPFLDPATLQMLPNRTVLASTLPTGTGTARGSPTIQPSTPPVAPSIPLVAPSTSPVAPSTPPVS
eukprot:Lankesteria_metandrocarpae@DN4641_c0_g1_i3.p2